MCLGPTSGFQGGSSNGFGEALSDGLELIGKHRKFHAFIKKGVPGYSEDNPKIEQLKPPEMLFKINQIGDNIVIPEDFYSVLRKEIEGIKIEEVRGCLMQVFAYRIKKLSAKGNVIENLRDNLSTKKKTGVSVFFAEESNTLSGDNYENAIAWINLPALKFLMQRIEDVKLKTTLLGIILGVGLFHEILGHESGIDNEKMLSRQDVDIFLTFLSKLTNTDREEIAKILGDVFNKHSLFLSCLNNKGLVEEIGLSKIIEFMERGDVLARDFTLIPYETTIRGCGNIKGLKAAVNASLKYGTKIKVVPAWNKNYGWYLDVYVWEGDGKRGNWSREIEKTFIFEKEDDKLKIKTLGKRSITQQEWVDYITEDHYAIDGRIVRPGPFPTKAYPVGQVLICMHIVTFRCRDLANREVRVELVEHPEFGELIYIYDKNKHEWELREIEKGLRKQLSAPAGCYKKTGRGKYKSFSDDLNYDQFLWLKWRNTEPGKERFTPPDVDVKCNKSGFVRLITDVIQFHAETITDRLALVKFVKDPRFKQFHPKGGDEFIFIYDKEKYERETLEIRDGAITDYSLPEKIYVKTAAGKLENVTGRLSTNQFVWLNWMHAENEEDVMRPPEILFHVPESGDVLLAHSSGKKIRLSLGSLRNRDAIAKLVDDPNFGQLIYIYDAADYYRQKREIKAGLRKIFTLPPTAYKKTGRGEYKKFPLNIDFNAYVWIEWAYQESGKETIKPVGELITQCHDDSTGTVYVGMSGGRELSFSSSALRGKERVLLKLVQDPQYGELVYIYDADRYMMEERGVFEGRIKEIGPPESCYQKNTAGKFISFAGNITLNQRSWAEWLHKGSVKPINDMVCEVNNNESVIPVKSTEFGGFELSVYGLKKGDEVRVKYIEDEDFGELIYVYVETQYKIDHDILPFKIYKKVANGQIKPFPGLEQDRLIKYSWLSYAYGAVNPEGKPILPRGDYLRGRVSKNGNLVLNAGDKRCVMYLNPEKYGGKKVRIVKYKYPKYEYIFKIFLETNLTDYIEIYVKNPDVPRFMRLEKHPDYEQGDENPADIVSEHETEDKVSYDVLLDQLIELAGWIKFWGLEDIFKRSLADSAMFIDTDRIDMEKNHHILRSMEKVFLKFMRHGDEKKPAILDTIKEYLFRVEIYDACRNLFNSEVSGQFVNGESTNCLYISEFFNKRKQLFNSAFNSYLEDNSLLKNYRRFEVDKDTKLEDVIEIIERSGINMVIIDISDGNREFKMGLINEVCDALPVPSFVAVVQEESEDKYHKKAKELLIEHNLALGEDTEIQPPIAHISHAVKFNYGLKEETAVDNIFSKIIEKLSDQTVSTEDQVEAVMEGVLSRNKFSPDALKVLALKISLISDESILEKLLMYQRFNLHYFKVDNKRYMHYQKALGPGKIQFNFMAPPGSEIFLIGDFTDWQSNPIKVPSMRYGGIRPDGLQRYYIVLDNLIGTHYFKYVVNGQIFENLNSVSPYAGDITYEEESFRASRVWSTRLVEDQFFTYLSAHLLKRIADDSLSGDIKRRITLCFSASVVHGYLITDARHVEIISKYLFTEEERAIFLDSMKTDFENMTLLRTTPVFMKAFYKSPKSADDQAILVVKNPFSEDVENCRINNLPLEELAFYEVILEEYDPSDLSNKLSKRFYISGKQILSLGDFKQNQMKICYLKKVDISQVNDSAAKDLIKVISDIFYTYFVGSANAVNYIWGLIKQQNKQKIKVIDSATLVFYDEELEKLYPRSLDFKAGLLKIREHLGNDVQIVIVNSDKRFNADEIRSVLGIQETGVAFVEIKSGKSYRNDLLNSINTKLKSRYKPDDLTIAYLDKNEDLFTRLKGPKFVRVADADNTNSFISGLGVLLAVLFDAPDFMQKLPKEVREEFSKFLTIQNNDTVIFGLIPQPMTKEYYSMLREEFVRVGMST